MNALLGLLISEGTSDQRRVDSNPRLVTAAHQFEASLMQELVKPLQGTDALFSDEQEDGSANALSSFGSEALAKAISDHGGLGIAREILDKFSKSQMT